MRASDFHDDDPEVGTSMDLHNIRMDIKILYHYSIAPSRPVTRASLIM